MRDRVLIDTTVWIAYFQRGGSQDTAEGKENHCAVYTLDRHFIEMQKEGFVTLVTF